MLATKLAALTTLTCLYAVGASAQARQVANLNTKHILGGDQACALVGSNVHFLSERYLVFFAGPDLSCYRAINQLELVVISTSGQVVAKKPWQSTFPIATLDGERLATADANNIVILDQHLQPVQTYPLPVSMQRSSVFLSRFGADTLMIRSPRGDTLELSGNPLQPSSNPIPPVTGDETTVFLAPDRSTYSYSPKNLFRTVPHGSKSIIASLAWINPCDRWCQEYEAGFSYSLAAGSNPRILFASNGSRFPVTDAAGLFPYFRVEVFDLANGAELYRKEFVTKTGLRSATISPDGSMIALSDGRQIVLEQLR